MVALDFSVGDEGSNKIEHSLPGRCVDPQQLRLGDVLEQPLGQQVGGRVARRRRENSSVRIVAPNLVIPTFYDQLA